MESPKPQSDYIVVGAGSAGCVIAARLTQDCACEVLLLEAGSENRSTLLPQPQQWPALWEDAQSWGYATTMQAGYNNRIIPYPRGKVVGGTGAINAMIYMRGDPQDFDHWEALGNPGWGWSGVMPYFLKSENQGRGPDAYHASNGPLPVSDLLEPHPLAQAFIDAATAVGHRSNPDFNGAYLQGAGWYQVTQKSGMRASTATAYLQPAVERAALTTVTRARVLRLLWEGDRAAGVEYFAQGQVCRAWARCEVILCAGAIETPKLLMLSGVGDPQQLQGHGIKVKEALRGVGKNLHDHPASPLFMGLKVAQKAPTSSNLIEAGLMMKSKASTHGYAADLQFFFLPYAPMLAATRGVTDAATITVQVCRPQSRGSLRLRSGDPLDPPLIDPAYLSHPADMALQLEGMRAAREIAAAAPLRAHFTEETFPGAAVSSDLALERAMRASSAAVWHATGTCRMGPDEGAVVDALLRVHGVRALRIADASVMPQITSANINAPVIMIAEKAADLIMDSGARGQPGNPSMARR